jgi:VanZ family protein
VRKLGLLLLVLLAVVIVLVVAVPNTTLAWLRSDFRWIGRAVNWVEALRPGWDTVHILLFGALGFIARLALPRAPMVWLLTGLVVFSAVSEVLQFWAPGRTARLTDFAQDVLGAMLGVGLATALMLLWRTLFRPRSGAGS